MVRRTSQFLSLCDILHVWMPHVGVYVDMDILKLLG